MKQCPKCKSQNTSLLSFRPFETLEKEYIYQCGDCQKEWVIYQDMNATDARDMKAYVEQQQYERGYY